MKLSLRLILILGTFVGICLFQNFDLPARNPYPEKKFNSNELDPLRRLEDYIRFQVSDETKDYWKSLEGRLEWSNDRAPASIPENPQSETSDNSETKNEIRYALLNINTFRIKDDTNKINCRIEARGLNIQWEHQMSASSSYVLEHNTSENNTQAKIQWEW